MCYNSSIVLSYDLFNHFAPIWVPWHFLGFTICFYYLLLLLLFNVNHFGWFSFFFSALHHSIYFLSDFIFRLLTFVRENIYYLCTYDNIHISTRLSFKLWNNCAHTKSKWNILNLSHKTNIMRAIFNVIFTLIQIHKHITHIFSLCIDCFSFFFFRFLLSLFVLLCSFITNIMNNTIIVNVFHVFWEH